LEAGETVSSLKVLSITSCFPACQAPEQRIRQGCNEVVHPQPVIQNGCLLEIRMTQSVFAVIQQGERRFLIHPASLLFQQNLVVTEEGLLF
jgi:hypothetical protein